MVRNICQFLENGFKLFEFMYFIYLFATIALIRFSWVLSQLYILTHRFRNSIILNGAIYCLITVQVINLIPWFTAFSCCVLYVITNYTSCLFWVIWWFLICTRMSIKLPRQLVVPCSDYKLSVLFQVNKYYDLVTSFYEYGWGESFHFAQRLI